MKNAIKHFFKLKYASIASTSVDKNNEKLISVNVNFLVISLFNNDQKPHRTMPTCKNDTARK